MLKDIVELWELSLAMQEATVTVTSRTGSRPSRRYTYRSQNMPWLTEWLLGWSPSWYLRFLFSLSALSFPVAEWEWSIRLYLFMKIFSALSIDSRRCWIASWFHSMFHLAEDENRSHCNPNTQSMLSFWNKDFQNSLADEWNAELWAF